MEFIYRTGKKITNKAQLWTKFVLTITIAISSQCLSEGTRVSMFGWLVFFLGGWGGYFCQLSFRVQ